jgi:hypothetical protein
LSGFYTTVWQDREKSKGMLESSEMCWIPPEQLNSEETWIAWRLQGKKTVEELLTEWREEDRPESDFWTALRSLGRQSAL